MNRDADSPEGINIFQTVFLVSAVIVVPGVFGPVFGWANGLLPLLVFYLLTRSGEKEGIKIIGYGLLLAGLLSVILQIVEQLFFALTLIPAGYILASSARKGEAVHRTGTKGVIILGGTWILFAMVLSAGLEHHPYTLLINSLNQGIDEAVAYYRTNGDIPAETLHLLELTFSQMKTYLPRIMPAMLGSIVLLVIWFTMITGNSMLQKKTGSSPWPEYKFWVLPDSVIWFFIAAALLTALPMEPGRTIGLNFLLVGALLYCFQGIAIMVFYFYKWNVPSFVRILVYVILFFQSFGAIFLALLGMADVWFDLRKLKYIDSKTDT